MADRRGDAEMTKGFSPCPTCHQYSHSIGDDALAKAFRHFHRMEPHPVTGLPMGDVFDDATKDAAQVMMARIGELEAEMGRTVEQCADAAHRAATLDGHSANDVSAAVLELGNRDAVAERTWFWITTRNRLST
jgi:hypothetical protein